MRNQLKVDMILWGIWIYIYSQISVTSEMDVSTSDPLDLSELNESKDHTPEKSSSTIEASRLVETVQTKQ